MLNLSKTESFLIRLNAILDTNEIEAVIFDISTETFSKKKFYLNKTIKFPDLKYIQSKYNEYYDDYNLIFLIVNTGLNSFYIIDYNSGICTEMSFPADIGFNPTFQRINRKYLISICGKNSDTVHILDTSKLIWYYVGRLQSGYRSGSYALYLKNNNIVFICGGMTVNCDNSLDVEFFDMAEFEKKISSELTENNEISIEKISEIQNNFLLHKSFPIVLNIHDYKTFIIGGGESLITKTDTCVFFDSDQKIILMSSVILPNPIKEENPNTFQTRNSIYFFDNTENIVRFDFSDKSFNSIENKLKLLMN